jgi:4-hydroxybenzoate polyprenyltransferase
MKSIGPFFQLMRPANLVIIVFTMYAMRWGVMATVVGKTGRSVEFHLPELHFALTVLVMVLLAAAGNMINDYFDLKVDRLNKPDRVLVGRKVKRRIVMLAHHSFNIFATLLAGFVAWRENQPWLVLVPVIMAALLWFYSLWFKRKLWIGNFIVALLVAVVPLWAGVFEIPAMQLKMIHQGIDGQSFGFEAWRWMFGYAGFAFWLTLIREVQKDLEDQKGDAQAGFKTLPIVWGRKGAHQYIHALYGLFYVAYVVAVFEISRQLSSGSMQMVFVAITVLGIGLPAGISWALTARARVRADYGQASRWSKIAMAGGISIGAVMPFWF